MIRALESLGLHTAAEAKLKQLVDLRTHSWGPGHQLTIEALLQLGACVDAQRRGEEALQIYKAVLDVEESQHRENHPLVAIRHPSHHLKTVLLFDGGALFLLQLLLRGKPVRCRM